MCSFGFTHTVILINTQRFMDPIAKNKGNMTGSSAL